MGQSDVLTENMQFASKQTWTQRRTQNFARRKKKTKYLYLIESTDGSQAGSCVALTSGLLLSSVPSQKSVKEGILLKQTSSFQRWKRRYFKLRGRTLYYAKDCKVRGREAAQHTSLHGSPAGLLCFRLVQVFFFKFIINSHDKKNNKNVTCTGQMLSLCFLCLKFLVSYF